jgi:hypothetical protein
MKSIRMSRRCAFLVIQLAFGLSLAAGQDRNSVVITGLVRDSASRRPIEYVNVFIASTTFGVGTDQGGVYLLQGVPPGRHHLIFSRVGYELKVVDLDLSGRETIIRNIDLSPRLISLGDVEVSANDRREWQTNFELFSRAFLGEGSDARQCVVTNPDALTFQTGPDAGELRAAANEPLLVVNRSLGFRLAISLSAFDWHTNGDFGSFLIFPFFRPLNAETDSEATVWRKNRTRVYEGSLQHFLSAVVHGRMEEEGYAVFKGSLADLQNGHGRYMFPEEIRLNSLPASRLKRWTVEGWLRVDRKGESFTRASYLSCEEHGALIDSAGVLDDPLSVRLLGRWSKERVASMLPVNRE